MSETKKTYWKGIEELNPTEEFVENSQKEFPDYLPILNKEEGEGTNRRDFLKLLGFGMAAATLAACETPVKKAIPYVNKPESIDPGVANFFASTYAEGGDYCAVLVKTREGRPIKIEGNTSSPITKGGTSARVQASVLGLYDEERLQGPRSKGQEVKWADIDKNIKGGLAAASSVRIVSNTIISPSMKRAIAQFSKAYNTKHVTYDSMSASGLLDAYGKMTGTRALPSYDFSKAKTIVSISADFLGTWLSPIEYAKQYSAGRKIGNSKKEMSKHYQFESNMTITGGSADYRSMIKPSSEGLVAAAIYNEVASALGAATLNTSAPKANYIKEAAKDLIANKGKSLVVAGTNDANVQLVVAKLNQILGNEGSTVDVGVRSYYRQGNDAEMDALIADAKGGGVSAVIFLGCNPIYDHQRGTELAAALKKVKLTVSTNTRMDETASVCKYVAPDNHYLESWSDAMPKDGHYSLGQPTISPLFKTRQALESMLRWSGNSTSAYDYIKDTHSGAGNFDQLLHNGVFTAAEGGMLVSTISEDVNVAVADTTATASIEMSSVYNIGGDVSSAGSAIASKYKINSDVTELVKYQKIAIGTGADSNNPWLQECPDPVTKACWDNYASISLTDADTAALAQDDLVTISDGKNSVTLPVLIQPGQANGTVAIAVGYGRTMGGKCADGVGASVYPFMQGGKITIAKTEGSRKIAQTQTHQTYFGRETIIQEAKLSEFKENSAAGRFYPKVTGSDGESKAPAAFDLWGTYKYDNHHWGMVVDLNSCNGCSACVVACQAENNIPVVGREEVINRREMHWMRIDRYYSWNEDFVKNNKTFGMDNDYERTHSAADDPEVVFQPMMCQHCNHASCETVCPVAATTHSSEGLNQMAYNRCIGTRYCANNCPYKVRRFNWFNYAQGDYTGDSSISDSPREFAGINPVRNDLGKMVLNPDVVVRTRGVMEKCSLCVQRIQAGKLEAKKAGRRPTDDDIRMACQDSCPTDAILFGDMLNPESKISKALATEQKERAYNVLEELNVKPNIFYLTKIRNKV